MQGFMAEKKRQREEHEKKMEETQNLLRIELVTEQTDEQAQKKKKGATRLKVLTICQLCKSKITKEITKEIILRTSNFSIFFSLFLANSKGKDKFIALFQYLF